MNYINNPLEYIIAVLLAVFQIFLVSYNVSPIKLSKREFIGLLTISFFFSLILVKVSEYSLNIIVALSMIAIIYLKTKNIIVALIVALFPTNITVFCNYIIANIFAAFQINIYDYNIEFSNYMMSSLVMLVLALAISKIIDSIFNKRLRLIDIDIADKQKPVIITFLGFSFLTLYFSLIFKEDFYLDGIVMFASFVIQMCQFGITTFVVFYFISEIKKEDEARRERELSDQMTSYTNELERMYVIAHGFKHDYRNILVTLSGYMDGNDIDGMKEYFYEELSKSGDIIPASGTVIKNLTNLKITPIKSLVSSKSATAQKFNIDFSVEVVEPIDYIRMPTLDLVRVVGIVLDNAIEASMKCDNPYVRFGIMKGIDTENSEVITILTTNNFTGEVPQLNRLYERGYSTKGDGRGIGLNNLKNIVDQYEYASIDIKIDDEKFCSKITILNAGSDNNA